MNHPLISLVFAISLCLILPTVSADTIKMIYGNLPPYMYQNQDTGEANGASVEYFERVATQMGYQVEWIGPLPQARFLTYIQTAENDIEGAISIIKFDQTEPFMNFTDEPYYLTHPSIAFRADAPLKEILNIENLKSYRIGGMAGDKLPSPFDQLKIEPIFEERWVQQNLVKLSSNRVDAVFSQEALMLKFHASQLQLNSKIKILSLPVTPTQFYVAFKKAAPRSKLLVEQYNIAVKTLQISFEEFLNKELKQTP